MILRYQYQIYQKLKKLKWKPEVNFSDGIKKMIEIDKKRLSNYKLLSPKQIKRIIIKFNKKI